MNNSRTVKTLKITGLFGQYDVRVEFSDLTVIVGKNGLGKTTLLKILKGFTTGIQELNYEDICETIELIFEDGNIISYGMISEERSNAVARKRLLQNMLHDKEGIESIYKDIDEVNPGLSQEEKKRFAERMINKAFNSSAFTNMLKNEYENLLLNNSKRIFSDGYHTTELTHRVTVRYISTVNISANAGNSIDLGNSIEKNLLDLAIHEELRLLLKKEDVAAVDAFKDQLNAFLKESGKSSELEHNDWVFLTETGSSLNLGQLSSGERQLVYILATAANTCGKQTLFLMDEPEVSLHLSWQERIIDAIMNINPQMQVIAVTHSPGIIMNGHMDAYVEMKDIMKVGGNV